VLPVRKDLLLSRWWGDFSLDSGATAFWRISSFGLWVSRLGNEWRVAYHRSSLDEDPFEWERDLESGPPPEDVETERYVFGSTKPGFSVLPVLADRPVVTRPRTPFYIPSGQDATIFVSSPLWVRITIHKERLRLQDLAIVIPSDTWFGPNTREGAMGYAMRTSARLVLEEVPRRPHRAVTPVLVRNRAEDALFLERLSIPIPYLPLFAGEDGLLWTPGITLTRESDSSMAALKIDEKAPRAAVSPVKVHEPRESASKGMLVRAFSALFD